MSAKINRPSSSIRGGLHDRESAEDNKKLALAGNSLLYPDEFESILSSMIDEEYIISVTGIKDISRIEYISLQIDTNFQSILDLTDLLPNLKHLVLDNSTVGSIRDLGVGLRGITSLSLSGCGLKDIDGIGVLTGLQELCLTDNYISDISPLTMHENLQNLNLSGNKIADLSFGGVLSSCPNLRSLFLSRNPIEKAHQYRAVVAYLIPSVEMLDGSPIDTNAALKVTASTLTDFTAALSVIEDEMDDEDRLENEIFASLNKDNGPTASINSACRPGTAAGHNTTTGGSMEGLPDTGSELTHGSAIVLAGNVAAAMRRRRNQQNSSMEYTAEAKCEGRRRGVGAVSGGETKEFESALEVLDSVLITPPSPAQIDDPKEKMFFKEGDITETVLGTPAKGKFKAELTIDALASPVVSKKQAPFSFDDAPTNLISATKRPKSAFTGTTYRLGPPSTSSTSGKLDSPDKRALPNDQIVNGKTLPAPSPRQKNSSRPQSAVNPALLGNMSLPFNVAVPASEASSHATGAGGRVQRRQSGRDIDDHDSDDEEGVVDFVRARKIVGMRTESDGSPILGRGKKGSSIVHLDIVKRTMKVEDIEEQSGSYTNLGNKAGNHGNGHDSDVEEIAITHSERLRMMSASTSNTTSTINKNRQNVLLKLQSKGSTHISLREDDDLPISARKFSSSSVGSGKNSISNSPRQSPPSSGSSNGTNGTASKAGISLGFNLAGSLAAIDQWVQDMSSEDEGSDDEQDLDEPKPSSRLMTDWSVEAQVMTPRTSLGNNGLKDKILSRDAIFHMCSNSSNGSEKRTKDSDTLLSSRRSSRNSILSTDDVPADEPPTKSYIKAPTHPIVQKAAQVSAQKAALLSKVAIAKVSSSTDPIATSRQSNPSTEQSFIIDDDKPSIAKITTNTRDREANPTKINNHRAVHMSDAELIDLLKQPPKVVPMLRTKTSFQDFFRGIEAHRFRKLLQCAYDDIYDKTERESKIKRRMELMEDVFA